MLDEAQSKRKQGTLTVLALLLSVLFGYGQGAVAGQDLTRSARLGQTDAAKPGATLRASTRTQAEDPDEADRMVLLPPAPQVRRDRLAARPAGESLLATAAEGRPGHRLPYQARAPPAA